MGWGMENLFFWLTLVLMVVDWVATRKAWERVCWFAKPAPMITLIAWFSLAGHWTGPLLAAGLGLVFSLLGDVLLMLPARFFLAGMGAFLVTQVAYIVGFNHLPMEFRWEILLPVAAAAGAFAFLMGRVRAGLRRRRESGLLVPIGVYAVVLSLMMLSALATLFRPGWDPQAALVVSLGGVLFFLSDATLAYHQFVARVPRGDLLVMVTYHLAQLFIAGGMLEQFSL